MQKWILYIRVSDQYRQGDNFSPDEQERQMAEYAVKYHWDYSVVIEKEGASKYSSGLRRSKLSEVLSMARRKEIHGIMYFKADRFTRDIADGIILRKELAELGIQLMCFYPSPRVVTDDFELLNIIEDWRSEQYVSQMREASMRGYAGKVNAGLYPQGLVPYGYRLEGKKKDTVLIIEPEHATVVRNIFEWCVYERLTTGQIAKRLNLFAIPNPGQILGRGTTWTSGIVYHLLRESCYTGTWKAYQYKKVGKRTVRGNNPVSIPIPPIIPQSLYDMAQSLRPKRPETKNIYILGGMVGCSCGSVCYGEYRIRKNSRTRYYSCNRSRYEGKCNTYYRADWVESAVWEFIKEIILSPGQLQQIFTNAKTADGSFVTDRLAGLQQEIAQQKNKLDELITLRVEAKQQSLQEVLDKRIQEASELVDTLTGRYSELSNLESISRMTEEYQQSLYEYIDAIKEEIADIDALQDVQAMRQIVQFLGFHFVLAKDNDNVLISIYWENQVTRVRKHKDGRPMLRLLIHSLLIKKSPPSL